ncbi:prepilin-type N-terminal cleavage/methylation domain-containing protein [Photobacterium damselae]|nr:prepilin-type N-terminal cleavage/methylation domain-containing protein [Photobacterium damselae]
MTSNIKTMIGFSLLEVVITLAVLSVGVLGLVKMQAYMEVKAENALKTLDALHIAESQMELFQTRSASGGSGTIAFDSISSSNATLSMAGETIYREIIVKDDTPISGAKKIIVTVSWSDRHGVSQAVSLKTVLSKYSEFD